MERIDDFVKVEEMIVAAEEQDETLNFQELQSILQRLDIQSGPYGHKRKDLITNLFRSIIEMALPGFIEYLFYGYEQSESEGFFSPAMYENKEKLDQNMGDESSGLPNNEESYEHEVLGYDPVTGKEFTRLRKRKPMRYYLPGIIGGVKNSDSMKQYTESIKWLDLSPEQLNRLKDKQSKVSQHYQNFKK